MLKSEVFLVLNELEDLVERGPGRHPGRGERARQLVSCLRQIETLG